MILPGLQHVHGRAHAPVAVEVLRLERERLAAVLGKPGRGPAEHVLAEAVFVAEGDAGAAAEV